MRSCRAVIVAHGQPGDPDGQQRAVMTLAAQVGALAPQYDVRGATLAAPGALAKVVTTSALIYPLFMAGGWFTKVELPRRLALTGAGDLHILPPFGADPGMTDLCLDLLRGAARRQGWDLAQTELLIAGHGSGRSRAPAQAVQDLARRLRPHVARIACGFIEEPPPVEAAARGFGPRAICLPFFATHAGHMTQDMPQALARAGFPGLLLPPVGLAPDVPAMIAHALAGARARQGRRVKGPDTSA